MMLMKDLFAALIRKGSPTVMNEGQTVMNTTDLEGGVETVMEDCRMSLRNIDPDEGTVMMKTMDLRKASVML